MQSCRESSAGNQLFFVAVVGVWTMLAQKVLLMEMLRQPSSLRIRRERAKRHCCHLLDNHGMVRSLGGRLPPAERSMARNKNRRKLKRIKFRKAPDNSAACIHFMVGMDFRRKERPRDRYGAMKVVGVSSTEAGNLSVGLCPGGEDLRIALRT